MEREKNIGGNAMNEKRILMTAKEAAKLLKENPNWTYKKAMDKAKEMIRDAKVEDLEKTN